jgi:hypothetical protein
MDYLNVIIKPLTLLLLVIYYDIKLSNFIAIKHYNQGLSLKIDIPCCQVFTMI